MVIALSLALGAYLVLHFVEPLLAVTWSYAHLGRAPLLPILAAVLVVTLPALAFAFASTPGAMQPPRRWSWRSVMAATIVLAGVLVAVGALFPPPHFSYDVILFVDAVQTGKEDNARWYLLLWMMVHLATWLRSWIAGDHLIRAVNGVWAAIAVVGLVGAARHLGRTRGEIAIIAVLALSTFGVAQLLIGYLDIYPMPLATTAMYLWAALAAIDGTVHPAVPIAIAALGPFWYIGLAQLVPSTVVIAVAELRRAGGARRLATAAVVTTALAGLATVPWFGRPFAFGAYLAAVKAVSKVELGLDPTSSLVPLDYMVSTTHIREVVHTVLLVDGVGWILMIICGAFLLRDRRGDPKIILLASIVVVSLAYMVTFDPLYGPYVDWDLYSYCSAASALLGAWALVTWARDCPRVGAALAGLAIAAACVHLLARLHALDVDRARHLQESPYHIATD